MSLLSWKWLWMLCACACFAALKAWDNAAFADLMPPLLPKILRSSAAQTPLLSSTASDLSRSLICTPPSWCRCHQFKPTWTCTSQRIQNRTKDGSWWEASHLLQKHWTSSFNVGVSVREVEVRKDLLLVCNTTCWYWIFAMHSHKAPA